MFFWKKKKEVSFDVIDTRGEDGHCFISGKVGIIGEVNFAGTLRIDGKVDGKVSVYEGKSGTLVLSKEAIINGPVEVSNMISDGTVTGDVLVRNKLECRTNAVIKGDVQCGILNTVDGAQLQGRCEMKPVVTKLVTHKKEEKGSVVSLSTRDISYLRKK